MEIGILASSLSRNTHDILPQSFVEEHLFLPLNGGVLSTPELQKQNGTEKP